MAKVTNENVLEFLKDLQLNSESGVTFTSVVKKHGMPSKIGTALSKNGFIESISGAYIWTSLILPNIKMAEKVIETGNQIQAAYNDNYRNKVKRAKNPMATQLTSIEKMHKEAARIDAENALKSDTDLFCDSITESMQKVLTKPVPKKTGFFNFLKSIFKLN